MLSLIIVICALTLIISTYTGLAKELYNKNGFWAFVNLALIFQTLYLFGTYFATGEIRIVPFTAFCVTGGILSFVRLRGNMLLSDSKMPPIDHNNYLDYAFGKKGQHSSYINLLFCVWFLVGITCSLAGVTFYGISDDEIGISRLGFFLSALSICITAFGQGTGFLKGISDILTASIVLYISTGVDIIAYKCLLILLGSMLAASGLYLGTSRDTITVRELS